MIWARYGGRWWGIISIEQIRRSALSELNDGIVTAYPRELKALVKEKIGKLGGVFCPTCMAK